MDKNVNWGKRFSYYLKRENIGKISGKLLREIIGETIFNLREFHKIKLYSGIPFWVSSKDKGLSLDLFVFKIRERSACKQFLKMLNKKDVVFDLGANIGYYVVQEAKIVDKVYAVEPTKFSYDLLSKNLNENNLINTKSYNLAIGNQNKLINFYVYNCANVSSVIPLKEHGDYKIQKTKMITGKKFLETEKITPNVLRMDVEGYELEILKSFKERLKIFNKFFIEVHTIFLGKKKVVELVELLEKNGFKKIGYLLDDKYTGKEENITWFSIKDFKKFDYPECFHLFVEK